MGTAERSGAAGTSVAVPEAVQPATQAPDRDIPANGHDRSAERHGATGGHDEADGQGIAVEGRSHTGGPGIAESPALAEGRSLAAEEEYEERAYYRQLWVEEPARRRRLPDPVRTAAVRALLIIAVTLIQAMVAFLSTLAGSWLAFPMVLSSVASTVVATWAALDVWVTRQVWNQRNGVVSIPSSTARALRRERRRARRQARTAERTQERIRRQGGAGQLSHS
ncbi:hypothetical protein [Streptomyces sp. NPDC060065]|uniref:hypothetical protein n=1 Tax=Streptomyces sp. NPDC060065 TaxID=3347050 RepID=UPI003689D4A2